MFSSKSPEAVGYIALRIAVSILLIIHGIARASLGIVDDFGGFLDMVGFPFGVAIAWAITITEIAGGLLLALGRWVQVFAVYFAIQLGVGIILVHAQEGWFVVGAGRNGVEYSVLLIVVLLVLAYIDRAAKIKGSTTSDPG